MKKAKTICSIAVVVVLAMSVTACREGGEPTEPSEANYIVYPTNARIFRDAQELTEMPYGIIITGKVTGISFQVIDRQSGNPPEERALENYRQFYGGDVKPEYVFTLATIYNIDAVTLYKGKTAPTQIRVSGGIRDVLVKEQLAILQEYGLEHIGIEEHSEIQIGETYLFVLRESFLNGGLPYPAHPWQAVYNLRNPFEKSTSDGFALEENPPEYYYSRSHADNGTPLISAYDIISTFGNDKWDAFWSDWKKDNVDWESRIDKAAVDEVLRRG